jgi:hypothetical protein
VSTTGDTAHNDTIFKLLPLGTGHCNSEEYRCTHVDSCMARLEYRIDVCHVTRGEYIEHLQLSNINFFGLSVAVNNSIKVGPLVFLYKCL